MKMMMRKAQVKFYLSFEKKLKRRGEGNDNFGVLVIGVVYLKKTTPVNLWSAIFIYIIYSLTTTLLIYFFLKRVKKETNRKINK
jgi:hypothetical protein